MSQSNDPMIVIDIGTGVCKAGLANKLDIVPKVLVPTVVGKCQDVMLVGDEALRKCSKDSLIYPVERGIIKRWNEMEVILTYIFDALKVNSRNQAVLLTQVPNAPEDVVDKLSKLMFEKYDVYALFIAKPQVLSLYAVGRSEGVVVEIGEGVTNIVPVDKGYAVMENVITLDFSGKDLTAYLLQSLTESGNTDIDMRSAQDIKERLCYVSKNFDVDSSTECPGIPYQVGNGKSVSVGKERFIVPEAFFKPNLTGKIVCSLPQQIVSSIMKCDQNLRETLFKSVVLTGSSAQFPGFADRLKQEMNALASGYAINIIVSPQQTYSAWMGGAILGALDTLKPMLVNKEDYASKGIQIVKEKCFKPNALKLYFIWTDTRLVQMVHNYSQTFI